MSPIKTLLGCSLFCITTSPLLGHAAEPDFSHLSILTKGETPADAIWQRTPDYQQYPIATIAPLVPASTTRSPADTQALQRHRLTRYFTVDTRHLTPGQAQALAQVLKRNPLLESVEFEAQVDGMHNDAAVPIAPLAHTNIPDYTGQQHYLQDRTPASPYRIGGVNAVAAWSSPGGKGQDMRIVSAEVDHWSYEHVDLPKPFLEVDDGAQTGYHDTASAGIMASRENGFGTTAITPEVQLGYLQWGNSRLMQLAEQLNEGDVVQIGVHIKSLTLPSAVCTSDCYMPVEYSQPVRDIITYLTEEKGVHVVLAAANGNVNLDHPYFNGYFDRDVFDSGSIYAGAVDPATGLRAWFSDYGKRVDVFSWGRNVTTTTWSASNPTTGYTHTFSGTSSSNPIIAGVAASLQGVARAKGLGNLPPKVLRDLLVATGYPPIDGNRTEIGVQPDLDGAIKKMLDDGADHPPTGRLALPEYVKSGETFSARVYAQSPSHRPLTYRWDAPGFTPPTASTESLFFTAPTVAQDTRATLSVNVSDGVHTLPLAQTLTVKAPPDESDCGGTPPWDASKIYQTYAEAVAYKGKIYKQNFYNINKVPDLNSADYGKEWLTGVACAR